MEAVAVPRRISRSDAVATAPVLPEDLVVWEILVRLPAKALLRCRAVCRSWCHLTSGADFLIAHHRHQPSLPLVAFRGQICASRCESLVTAIDAFDLRGESAATARQPVLRFNDNSHRRRFTVHASCDGLLVLSLCNNRFYICNPATRQWATLPRQLTGCYVAALYRHNLSGEYRILYWKGNYLDAVYYVLTVGSSVEPRCIGQFKASSSPPVLLRSCLHWIFHLSQQNELVLVFDTILESFRSMSSPTTDNAGWANVLEVDSRLGFSCIKRSQTTVDLWVLEDYETEVWSLKSQIELPVAELRSIAKGCMFNGLIVSEEGDMLVHCAYRGEHLFYWDNKDKLLQKFHWDRVLLKPTKRWFKESLVLHAFFKRQGSDRVRNPCFFQGL